MHIQTKVRGYVYDIYIGKNNSGIFSMHKTSEIDRQPLTEAEANANGWAAPAQRTQNGLYTEEEAIEIGYQFSCGCSRNGYQLFVGWDD